MPCLRAVFYSLNTCALVTTSSNNFAAAMSQIKSSFLHPSSTSPTRTAQHHVPQENQQQQGAAHKFSNPTLFASPKHSFWQWITFREIVFIFLLCSSGILLFRSRDSVLFKPSWQEMIDPNNYANKKFPLEEEKEPLPVVSDLDGDGNMEILLFTYGNILKLLSFSSSNNAYTPMDSQNTIDNVGVDDISVYGSNDNIRAVAIATGYLQRYQSMVQLRKQVVVVLLSDWTVLCFDHTLKLLWKADVGEKEVGEKSFSISEAAVLVSSVSIHKGDYGSVIIGGREVDPENIGQSVNRLRRVVNINNEEQMLKSLGHYTMLALEGRGGVVRWHHTPKDFQKTAAYSPEVSSFRHLKLVMSKHAQHTGEVSWHQYSNAISNALPHSWAHSTDTHFNLAHFQKDSRPSEKSEIKDHISKVGGLAMDHISGLAFGGHPPHSPSEHVQDPNVIILHSIKGIEVVHLYQGRPLCILPLSPYHSSHLDINGDGVIEHISAVLKPGENRVVANEDEEGDCYGMASPMSSKPLFKHSICKSTHWTEIFINTDKWLPHLNKIGRKSVNHRLTEPLAPILLPSSYHSNPLKLHMGAPGWDLSSILQNAVGSPKPLLSHTSSTLYASPAGTLYDSIFVLSSGRITSIGPHGEFNWQVDSQADWDYASQVIFDPSHPSRKDMFQMQFIHSSFVPSATAFSLQVNGKEDHVLVVGWNKLTLLSGEDGQAIITLHLQGCHPVAPVLVQDFTGDGWNDVIITCSDKYWGISLYRKSGFWHKTLLGSFVGVAIVAVAMYIRQRTVGLLPPVKSD